jgi:hypothetical protein
VANPDFFFHTDPGHGWLEVKIADVEALGLRVSDFTQYSYRREDSLFLEEDCDASCFISAWEAKHGREIVVRDLHSRCDSFIRNLPRLPVRLSKAFA